jgi:hypothetical protein
MIDITMRIWFSYLTLANTTFEKYNRLKNIIVTETNI